MSQSSVIKVLDEIKSLIQNNPEKYDNKLLNDLLRDFREDINLCVKIDEMLLNFFKNKKSFRTIADLKKFSVEKLKHKLKKTKRADIEVELTKVSTNNKMNIEKLEKLLGKPIAQVKKKSVISKTKPKAKKAKIEDQTSRWISLTSDQLRNELDDFQKYPDPSSLKQAADSILESNEKRYRKREKIINIILERIAEDRAIVRLGR